ncbi:MAG: glycoside hydrolase family 88 protein [Deltaproteobacteria bacterium]|nr:glycoside hydrolase family 88 protein [Deltaproteobacteria bacterium]
MMLANSYFMRKWPNPGADIVTDKVRPSNLWTRAVYYEGLMALHRISPQPEYLDYALDWADSNNWNVAYQNPSSRDADHQCCGQTYLDLLEFSPQRAFIDNITACIDNVVASTVSDDWWWIDAIQMAMPIYARLGVLNNDTAYFDKMDALYTHTRNIEGGGLFNETDGLWWRDADFVPPHTTPNGEHEYWARGNGWVYAALTRVLDVLPGDAPQREGYVADFLVMSDALLKVRRSDGFWNVSLHDAGDFGGRELTGTALFVYGMAFGVRTGLLDAAVYRPIVMTSWNALVQGCLHDDGFLGYVQGTGKQPSDGQPVTYSSVPNFEDYGLGCFLLAGSETARLIAAQK